jgi:hypothetical protein
LAQHHYQVPSDVTTSGSWNFHGSGGTGLIDGSMNQVIRNISLKDECSLFKKEIIGVTFENCSFDHLVLSDLKFENVEFINCRFDHVFIESFYAKNILIKDSEVSSLSLRGNRKITSKKLFQTVKNKAIEEVRFDNTNIIELILGGNLQVVNCTFPKSVDHLHIKNPFLVYNKCLEYIDKHWEGERKRIGMLELQGCLSKEVEKQNEDFITYSYNDYLEKDINEILQSTFLLIKKACSIS